MELSTLKDAIREVLDERYQLSPEETQYIKAKIAREKARADFYLRLGGAIVQASILSMLGWAVIQIKKYFIGG